MGTFLTLGGPMPLRAQQAPELDRVQTEVQGVDYHALEFQTVDGVGYDIEVSADLLTWSATGFVYGFGQTVIIPLIEVSTGGGGGGTPLPLAFLKLESVNGGGTLASWSSLDFAGAVQHYLPSLTLGAGWSTNPLYSGEHGGYSLALLGDAAANLEVASSYPTLGISDADLIGELETHFSTIDAAVGSQSGDVPLPPVGGSGALFVRVAADFARDSDLDGIPDVREEASVAEGGTGTQRFNADSDDDSVHDGAEAAQNTDPNDPNDTPTENVPSPPPAGSIGDIQEGGFLDHHKITSDNRAASYANPQWVVGSHNFPTAYTRGGSVHIRARFLIPGNPQTIHAQAKTNVASLRAYPPDSNSPAVPPTALTRVAGTSVWELDPTACSGTLPDAIKFFSAQEEGDEFALHWELYEPQLYEPQIGWESVGSTKHTVYIGLRDPTTPTRRNAYQESLWSIACRNADDMGHGANPHETTIVDAVYFDFTDQKVARVKPTQGAVREQVMSYWKKKTNTCMTAGEMLATKDDDGDGNCTAWAHLFIDSLEVIGLDAGWVQIQPIMPEKYFTIKNPWKDDTADPSNHPTYPWIFGASLRDLVHRRTNNYTYAILC